MAGGIERGGDASGVRKPRRSGDRSWRSTRRSLPVAIGLCCGLSAASWAAEDQAGASGGLATPVFDTKGLTVRAPDEAIVFNLGGRLHVDAGSGGAGDGAITGEFPDTARVRRLWIEPTVTIARDYILTFQYDVSTRTQPINNLYLSYTGWKDVTLTLGNVKEPFSFEQLMANNDLTFAERSLADAFAPGRNTGAAIGAHGEAWTVAAGVFGGNVNDRVDRGGYALTTRATWAPVMTQEHVLHLGIAGSSRALDRRGPDLAFDTSPESFLFAPSLVDTDVLEGARRVERLGLEAAGTWGPLRVQAEYVATRVERDFHPTASFQGGYVHASWVLNGRAPAYKVGGTGATEIGVFERVKPADNQRVSHGGLGVFEIAARFSAIALDDRDVRGGTERNVTVGLNWYPDLNVRVLANYIHADVDRAAPTGRGTTADIGQVQFQIAF